MTQLLQMFEKWVNLDLLVTKIGQIDIQSKKA